MMPQVHNAKKIIETIFAAMESETGANITDDVRLYLPKHFSLVITHHGDTVEMAFAPPADLYVQKLFSLLKLHGTLERLVISKDRLVAEIGKLPDVNFEVMS